MPWSHLTRGQATAMVLLAAAFLINGAWAIHGIRAVTEAAESVSHSHQVLAEVDGVLSTLQDAETGQRGYLPPKSRATSPPTRRRWPAFGPLSAVSRR
jgi:CHASE3 domain sensor protein